MLVLIKMRQNTLSKIYKDNKGFTLIELLVAITIIAVLASMGAVVYSSSLKTVRATKRADDLKSIATALESYKAVNGKYPPTASTDLANGWRSMCTAWNAGGVVATANDTIPGLTPTFMQNIPIDPKQDSANGNYCTLYTSNSEGDYYKLLLYRITEFTDNDYKSRPDLVDPVRDGNSAGTGSDPTACTTSDAGTGYSAWAVYSSESKSPGGRCR